MISVLLVLENAEEALKVRYYTGGFNEVRLVTRACDPNVLPNQRDAVVLGRGHDLLSVLGQIELHADSQIIRCDIPIAGNRRFVGVQHESILLLDLTELNSADMDDRRSVDMIRKHDLSATFALTSGFTVRASDLKNSGLTGLPASS